jgi:hypothetical protein
MDLRRHTRVPVDFTLLVENAAGEGHLVNAVDLSLGGLRFNSVGFSPRETDAITTHFTIARDYFSIGARVVRAKELDMFCHEVGVQFESLEPGTTKALRRSLHGC